MLPQLSISRLDPLSQVFSLCWTQHQANMLAVFERLLHTEAFTDVTLAYDGGSFKFHKIVLAVDPIPGHARGINHGKNPARSLFHADTHQTLKTIFFPR